MHHPSCSCSSPPRVLLPRIIHTERRQLQRLCAELHFTELPACLHAPLHITNVCASGSPCSSETRDGPLCVSIPVCVQLCDACGAKHTAHAVVQAEVCPPRSLGCCDSPSLYIQPTVQLLHAEPLCGCKATVQLCITLEIYLLRLEPCGMNMPKPACPTMPLYPPPIQPRW